MTEVLGLRLLANTFPGEPASSLPDVLATDLAAVFCGINPGLRAAASGHHFDGSSNRFWRVLHLAGFTPGLMRPEEGRALLALGYGLTTAVSLPTARASQLAAEEFLGASAALLGKVEHYRPQYIAFLGKAAYAALSGLRHVPWGRQAATFGGARVWVLPNPSGLNRAFRLGDLVEAYGALHLAIA